MAGSSLGFCVVLLDPFQYPVSLFDPGRLVVIGLVALPVAPVLFLLVYPRVVIQPDGLIVRALFRTTGVLFQEITRITTLQQGQAFLTHTSDVVDRRSLELLDGS